MGDTSKSELAALGGPPHSRADLRSTPNSPPKH